MHRVILGKHLESDLTWVFVQPYDDGQMPLPLERCCYNLSLTSDADGWWYDSQFIEVDLEDVAEFWQSEHDAFRTQNAMTKNLKIQFLMDTSVKCLKACMSYLMSGNMNSIQYKLNIFIKNRGNNA